MSNNFLISFSCIFCIGIVEILILILDSYVIIPAMQIFFD